MIREKEVVMHRPFPAHTLVAVGHLKENHAAGSIALTRIVPWGIENSD